MTRRTALIATLATLLIAVPAQAHVTLQPNSAPAGQFTRLDVRVPNERDDVPTTKIEVQMPDGFASVSYEPVPGWTVEVTSGPLDTPIQTDDGEITEGVKQITWTADSDDDGIPPGAFQDFGLSFQVPGKAGDKLEFKALQTYAGGEVVRWIGAEGSDNPAAVVSVVEPQGTDAASHGGGTASEEATPAATTAAAASTSDDDSGNGLAIVALIVGALGLVVGAAGLLAARRASGRSGAAA
jgi:periplasmic copper chaperone A